MACFVFLFLGGSKDLSIGPEAVLAILTLEITNKGIEYVVLLTFLSGVIILVLAIFRLGKFFGALFFFRSLKTKFRNSNCTYIHGQENVCT
jgi:MFS superfamily sulfate permease-like transporter